jgi:predicted nucleic acid-binding protein
MNIDLIFDASSIYILVKRKEFDTIQNSTTIDLAYYELGNAMLGELRRKVISSETYLNLGKVLKGLLEIMSWIECRRLDIPRILRICETSTLSFYDATYLALAQTLGDSLTTNDSKLGREALRRGIKTYSVPHFPE